MRTLPAPARALEGETMNETTIYREAVETGELEIDAEGRIWRVAKRHGNQSGTQVLPVERRRAERHLADYRRGTDRGYLVVRRKRADQREIATGAHRLVWLHFHGPIPEGLEINHRNGDKQDNRPDNLQLVTTAENAAHAYETGLRDNAGENNPNHRRHREQRETTR